MEILREIGIQVIEILTLIIGILGMTLSLMLLFAPSLAKSLSAKLNRTVDVDKKLEYLDKDIEINVFFYNHNVLAGVLLIAGSLFSLFFFFFSLDITKVAGIIVVSREHVYIAEVILNSIAWIGKVGCLAALFFGSLLLFSPDALKRVENKLNSWFETRPVLEKLDKSSDFLDTFFFRHTTAVGLLGTVISFFLISLSIINLLR